MTIAKGSFTDAPHAYDTTKLETEIAFLAIKMTLGINDIAKAVATTMCETKRNILQTWLSSIASQETSYNVEHLFGRGHVAVRSAAVVYVSKCKEVSVTLRHDSPNCTDNIPIIYRNTSQFVDPISFLITSVGQSQMCTSISPPRYLIANTWFCARPHLEVCLPPKKVPVDAEGNIDRQKLNLRSLHLGYSIYSKDQMSEFNTFAEIAGARKSFLAQTAHTAIQGSGEWGGITEQSLSTIVDHIGINFIPLYALFGRPATYIITALFCFTLIKIISTFVIRAIVVAKLRGCGLWVLYSMCGTLFLLALTPIRAVNRALHDAVDQAMVMGPARPDGPESDHSESDAELKEYHGGHHLTRMYPDVKELQISERDRLWQYAQEQYELDQPRPVPLVAAAAAKEDGHWDGSRISKT